MFPLSKLFKNCVPPAVVPIEIKYPVAVGVAFHEIFELMATFVALFAGETIVAQAGTTTIVWVVKLVDVQPTAFPAELYGVMVTK